MTELRQIRAGFSHAQERAYRTHCDEWRHRHHQVPTPAQRLHVARAVRDGRPPDPVEMELARHPRRYP